jgi:hypothetical protein
MIEVQKAKNAMTVNLSKMSEKEARRKRVQLMCQKRDQLIRHAIQAEEEREYQVVHAEEEMENQVLASHQIAIKTKFMKFKNLNKLQSIKEMS